MERKKRFKLKEFEVTEKFLAEVEALASCRTLEQIAGYFNISEVSLRRLKKNHPEIETAYKKGIEKANSDVKGKILELALEGDRVLLMFWAKTQMGWREKQDINLSSEDGSMKSPPPLLVSFIDTGCGRAN